MIDRLVEQLVATKNEAADDVLLEALRIGVESEQVVVLDALVRRKTPYGLRGVIATFDELPESIQVKILSDIPTYYTALRECGRSPDGAVRVAAMRLIALGRQGKLCYVLTENLHDVDESISKTACEALTALARWVSTESRRLHGQSESGFADAREARRTYEMLMTHRPEIEQAVARALDVHRGKHGPDLVRAAMLLCDSPQSKTLAILQTPRHGGQGPIIRKLQSPATAENVDAFLLAAARANIRSHFGPAFSHTIEGPALDALLRRTHWLKDQSLVSCVHSVQRAVWLDEKELSRDLSRRSPADAARVADWLVQCGVNDVLQDERLEQIRRHCGDDPAARLRVLRVVMRRKRSASTMLIKAFLTDPDENIARIAAREIVKRRPPEFENTLLPLMAQAPLSVRRVISRAIGHAGFEQFWNRFDKMDKPTRRGAGRAMLKLLPDGLQRLARRLENGAPESRTKALQIVQELGLTAQVETSIISLLNHPSARVRSKAVAVLGELPVMPTEVMLERALGDNDARVRASAIEFLEEKRRTEFVPMLADRARSAHPRERANAIKALHRMRVPAAKPALLAMLRDPRGEHRVSALWALRQMGMWEMLEEVGKLAREDANLRVRRYALNVIRAVAEMVEAQRGGRGATQTAKAG
jgi:hypothetical protein